MDVVYSRGHVLRFAGIVSVPGGHDVYVVGLFTKRRAREHVVSSPSARQGVGAFAAADEVAVGATRESPITGLGTELVAAQHRVPALPTGQGVGAPEPQQDVVAAVARQDVGTVGAPQGVVAGATGADDCQRHPAATTNVTAISINRRISRCIPRSFPRV